MQVETVPLTIRLPQPEVRFLENYASRHRFSVAELFSLYIKQLQFVEQMSASSLNDAEIEAELAQHAGVIPPEIDVRQEYYDYLEEKHT